MQEYANDTRSCSTETICSAFRLDDTTPFSLPIKNKNTVIISRLPLRPDDLQEERGGARPAHVLPSERFGMKPEAQHADLQDLLQSR